MKVSVIIPCYNQFKFLQDAVYSAWDALRYDEGEIIIVNDGSTDQFDFTSVFPVHPQLHYLTKENGGLSSARNFGIKHAAYEWILPLDADDKINKRFIEDADEVQKQTGADVIGSWMETFGDYVKLHKAIQNPTYTGFSTANRINCCSFFRKSMWESIGGYDENMRDGYEDWEFWLSAAEKGFKFEVIQDVLFYYRKHGVTMLDHARSKRSEIIRYIKNKHGIK